jgi:hypothetical protein
MTEPIFPAIGGVIAATVLVICKFYSDGKRLEEKTRGIVNEKAQEIDAGILKANVHIVWDIIQNLRSKYGEEVLETLMKTSAEALTLMPHLEIDKELDIEKLEKLPEELRIRDESRDPLIRWSLLAVRIRRVPSYISQTVSNILKSIILGIILAIWVSITGLSIPPDLRFQMASISVILGILYCYLGPYQIWRLNQLETKILEMEKSKKINDIEKTLGAVEK